MNKIKKLKFGLSASIGIIVLMAVVLIGGGVRAYSSYTQDAPKAVAEAGGTVNIIEAQPIQVIDEQPVQAIDQPTEASYGALTSPTIASNYLSVNGVMKFFYKEEMQTGTTTLCSFLSPSATSTLESLDYQITVGTSTAATIVASVSTNPYATSTATNIVAAQSVAANAQDTMSNNFGASVSQGDISPSRYVLIKTEGPGLSGYTYTGKCQVVFRLMP